MSYDGLQRWLAPPFKDSASLFSPHSSTTARCSSPTMAPTWTWSRLWPSSGTSWRASSRMTQGRVRPPGVGGGARRGELVLSVLEGVSSKKQKQATVCFAHLLNKLSRTNRLQSNRRVYAFGSSHLSSSCKFTWPRLPPFHMFPLSFFSVARPRLPSLV